MKRAVEMCGFLAFQNVLFCFRYCLKLVNVSDLCMQADRYYRVWQFWWHTICQCCNSLTRSLPLSFLCLTFSVFCYVSIDSLCVWMNVCATAVWPYIYTHKPERLVFVHWPHLKRCYCLMRVAVVFLSLSLSTLLSYSSNQF